MAFHKDFPLDPFSVIKAEHRWKPDQTQLISTHRFPPLVAHIRPTVQKWRDDGYPDVSNTSRSLLNWWFTRPIDLLDASKEGMPFRYYFCQREAVETVIFLYDHANLRQGKGLMRFDIENNCSKKDFATDWLRLVIKMATGTGKTKVISLIMAWCYFHKSYELDSQLARNFLLLAPNIAVFDRLRSDFEGGKIFQQDPILPPNGTDGRDWETDFKLQTKLTRDFHPSIAPLGNLFLTNVHQIYDIDRSKTEEDAFLGPSVPTSENARAPSFKLLDIVSGLRELVIFNDEAHHLHDSRLEWVRSIKDVHTAMLAKNAHGSTVGVSMQIDLSATPKHESGSIFVPTVSDYTLVEAIQQNILKRPVVPKDGQIENIIEEDAGDTIDKYRYVLDLGYEEWRRQAKESAEKTVIFVMAEDAIACNAIASYYNENYPDLRDRILSIHIAADGEINRPGAIRSTSSSSNKVLSELRHSANTIDSPDNPYCMVVSVLMLREGWDVKRVNTIVGIRAFNTKSLILPEQALGRGLRRINPVLSKETQPNETLSVVGTSAFIEFINQLSEEGIDFDLPRAATIPTRIFIDTEGKDINELNIILPILSSALKGYDEDSIDIECTLTELNLQPIPLLEYSSQDVVTIDFEEVVEGKDSHQTELRKQPRSYSATLKRVTEALRDHVLSKVSFPTAMTLVDAIFTQKLFAHPIDRTDLDIRHSLDVIGTNHLASMIAEGLRETLVLAPQAMPDASAEEIKQIGEFNLLNTRPFFTILKHLHPSFKTPFNLVPCDNNLEYRFAKFLDNASDVAAYAKNTLAVGFRIDYLDVLGALRYYYPDFLVRKTDGSTAVVETKGQVLANDVPKRERLIEWTHAASAFIDHPIDTFVVFNEMLERMDRSATLAELKAIAPNYVDIKFFPDYPLPMH